ncbi:MAG: hypothetical protein IJI68_09815 [Eggerthellaceae bacterium]|nr:hypothetical protein [Eggerthellaceae bacterium]
MKTSTRLALIALIMGAVFALALFGCGGDNDTGSKIVGTWKSFSVERINLNTKERVDSSEEYEFVFYNDNTWTMRNEDSAAVNGTWEVEKVYEDYMAEYTLFRDGSDEEFAHVKYDINLETNYQHRKSDDDVSYYEYAFEVITHPSDELRVTIKCHKS